MDRVTIGDKIRLDYSSDTYTVRSVVPRGDEYDLALFVEGSRELIQVTAKPDQIEILQ